MALLLVARLTRPSLSRYSADGILGGSMKVAYVAGPYRADTIWGVKRNIRNAEKYAMKYWRLGYAVICPHANSALFPGDPQMYLDGDIEILKRCDVIVMIPGWEKSQGAKDELEKASVLGKEIIYETED